LDPVFIGLALAGPFAAPAMDKSDFPGQWAEMQLLTLVVVGKQHCRTDSQRKGW
jgi:hypothetical protein